MYKRAEPLQVYFYFCLADVENESTSVVASTTSVTRSEG